MACPIFLRMIVSVYFELLNYRQDLTDKALILSMKQVKQYGLLYRGAIIAFKTRHFEDRSQVGYVVICSIYLS